MTRDALKIRLYAGTASCAVHETGPAHPLDADSLDAVWSGLATFEPVAEPTPHVPHQPRPQARRPGSKVTLVAGGPQPPPTRMPPLAVVSARPEGAVDTAEALSVTFNQPVGVLGGPEVMPVAIEPQVAGAWRWVGARTAMFEPEVGFPGATSYTATVQDNRGQPLHLWCFETRPLTVVAQWPTDPKTNHAGPVALVFDQRVDRDALAPWLELRVADAPAQFAFTDALPAKLAAFLEPLPPDRWIALEPVLSLPSDSLPPGSAWHVVLGAGAPSAEGDNPAHGAFELNTPSRARRYWDVAVFRL